ncbi:hypothetical protein B9Z55_001116 [Caenorhabditis nigoni]|nr:hypothetical protein B9Z55_001116 [Caenorhabditis nigoni]
MGKETPTLSKAKHKEGNVSFASSPLKYSARQTPAPSSSQRNNERKRTQDETPSRGGPAIKKNRLEADVSSRRSRSVRAEQGTSQVKEEENTRGRRFLKHGEAAIPQCTMCKEEQKPEDELLMECTCCKSKYHINKCLRYKDEIEANIRKSRRLICPRCIHCSACEEFIGDPENLECSQCCHAWHGSCAPKGHFSTNDFDSAWFCASCCRKRNIRMSDSPEPTRPSRRKIKGFKPEKPINDIDFAIDINVDELAELQDKRDQISNLLAYEAGFSSEKPQNMEERGNKKRRKGDEDDFLYTGLKKNQPVPKVARIDKESFEQTKKEAYPKEVLSSEVSGGQTLHFGTGKACKAVYKSAYGEPLQSASDLYFCKFCIYTTHHKQDLIAHWDNCTARHPPGDEIYRDEDIAFFEVDGAVRTKYCQDLCLLAKLFISSKTLYAEVETFIFYVLCEITTEGYVIVGYFSKEKNPSKNNNLSCLLVLPMVQKMGYGRLLIDMSYELSRLELKVGHPEHPLSDLGILAYRGYWRSSLLCYLRQHRKQDRISIRDISLATRMTPSDIVNQLLLDNIIALKGDNYTIKLGKRAFKFPISQCRRKCIDPRKLFWTPKPPTEPLDPTKLNSYAK